MGLSESRYVDREVEEPFFVWKDIAEPTCDYNNGFDYIWSRHFGGTIKANCIPSVTFALCFLPQPGKIQRSLNRASLALISSLHRFTIFASARTILRMS